MKIFSYFLFVTYLISLLSCKRKESAGFGGNANLKLMAKHHGLLIDSCTFYIKFNAKDVPSSYDETRNSVTYSVGNSYATISGLKKGDYYIYCSGWDPSINEVVKGGLPYTVTEEKDQDVIVAVTE